MKKIFPWMIAVLMLIPALTVHAGEEKDVVAQIISCPEQNFSTVCRPECTYDFVPDGGLQIKLGDGEDAGYITIFKADAPGSDFAAETYFNNAWLNMVEASYGEDLLDPGEYTVYPFADQEMPGRMALYLKDGVPQMRYCLYDLEEDYFVRYEAFCVFDEAVLQSTIDDLSTAVRYFEPDAQHYSGSDVTKTEEPKQKDHFVTRTGQE